MAKVVELEVTIELPEDDAANPFLEQWLNDLLEDVLYDYSEIKVLDFTLKGVYD